MLTLHQYIRIDGRIFRCVGVWWRNGEKESYEFVEIINGGPDQYVVERPAEKVHRMIEEGKMVHHQVKNSGYWI